MTGPTAKFWDLPAPWKSRWSFAPGSFSWKPDGVQWVPIVPDRHLGAQEIGRACLFERSGALFAKLHFFKEFRVLEVWLQELPQRMDASDPALKLSLLAKGYLRRDEDRMITHADALAIAMEGLSDGQRQQLSSEIDGLLKRHRRPFDADGFAIADWLREQEEAQDRNG